MKNTMKRLFATILVLSMILSTSIIAYADDKVLTGNLNDGITYSFDTKSGTLSIDGNGDVEIVVDYYNRDEESVRPWVDSNEYPWYGSNYERNKLIFGDGITGVTSCELLMCFKQIHFGAGFDLLKYIEDEGYCYHYWNEDCTLSEDNESAKLVDGVLYSKDMTKLLKFPISKSDKNGVFYVPSGVKEVCTDAFGGYLQGDGSGSSFKYVVFPKSVTTIHQNYFEKLDAVFVLNPKCGISSDFGDDDLFNFNQSTIIYQAGRKNYYYSSEHVDESENDCAPLVFKNTRYYALYDKKYDYTGKNITPNLIVLNKNGKILKNKKDYTLKLPKKRKTIGTYTIIAKGKKGNKKAVKLKFYILPKKVVVTSVKRKGGKITLKWKNHKAQTTGFQIKYATNYDLRKAKTITIKNKKATSKTIKNINKKKFYYIRIRAYKKVKGKKYYSRWKYIEC